MPRAFRPATLIPEQSIFELQSLKNEDAENIGYVIPPPVIAHFLDDFERNGRYTGFPALGLEWQKMESPFLQKAMHMKVRYRLWTMDYRAGSHAHEDAP